MTVVDDVEDGSFSSLQVPGPIGVTGRLRNLYIDADIRIAEGVQLIDSDIDARDIYIRSEAIPWTDIGAFNPKKAQGQ